MSQTCQLKCHGGFGRIPDGLSVPGQPIAKKEELVTRRQRLIVAVVLAATFTFVAVAFAAAAKDSYTFDAKNGKVTFNHKAHADKVGQGKCNTCHHSSKGDGSDAKGCKECHKAEKGEKDGKEVPAMKDAAHKKCKGCHEKDAEKKAPTKCTDCHKK
ncbi:MAG: cytochrome c3 family protein [Deltaproteobacteria bacterium]|nr:cytochrome c3 family protein [Deltaproteobacteria bacterium]